MIEFTRKCRKCGYYCLFNDLVTNNDCPFGKARLCKCCQKKYRKKHYKKNKEHELMLNKQYIDNNRTELNKKRNQRWKKKPEKLRNKYYKINYRKQKQKISYRLHNNLKSRIHRELKNFSSDKYYSSIKYLGMSIDEYKKFIENLWTEGMNWDNWGQGEGQWQIHHLIPLHTAEDEEELHILLNFSNTYPLWYDEHWETHRYLNRCGL